MTPISTEKKNFFELIEFVLRLLTILFSILLKSFENNNQNLKEDRYNIYIFNYFSAFFYISAFFLYYINKRGYKKRDKNKIK